MRVLYPGVCSEELHSAAPVKSACLLHNGSCTASVIQCHIWACAARPVGMEGRKKSFILLQWPLASYLHATSTQTHEDGWRETGQGRAGGGGISVWEVEGEAGADWAGSWDKDWTHRWRRAGMSGAPPPVCCFVSSASLTLPEIIHPQKTSKRGDRFTRRSHALSPTESRSRLIPAGLCAFLASFRQRLHTHTYMFTLHLQKSTVHVL